MLRVSNVKVCFCNAKEAVVYEFNLRRLQWRQSVEKDGMKVGIISGIISSVIVAIFIQPILSFIWDAVIGIAGAVQQGYVDRIYRNAALGDRDLLTSQPNMS
jgi:hypothetical protein